jgi:hypothetical protein
MHDDSQRSKSITTNIFVARERSAIMEFNAGSTPAAKATSMTFWRNRNTS